MKDSELLEAVRLAAVLHIWEFNPQNLSNTAWAFTTLVLTDSELLETLRLAAVLQIWEFTVQELAGIMWAFAKGSQGDVSIRVLEKLSPEGVVRLDLLFGEPVRACEQLRQVPNGILWLAACGNRNVGSHTHLGVQFAEPAWAWESSLGVRLAPKTHCLGLLT